MPSEVCHINFTHRQSADPVFILSQTFQCLHGFMRQEGIGLVLAPYHIDAEGVQWVGRNDSGPPDGIRVYSRVEDLEAFQSGFSLPGYLQEGLICSLPKVVDGDEEWIRVRRIQLKSTPSALRRAERRHAAKPDDEALKAFKATHRSRRKERPGLHFWIKRGEARYPIFLGVSAISTPPEGFASHNTYGAGLAPAAGLKHGDSTT